MSRRSYSIERFQSFRMVVKLPSSCLLLLLPLLCLSWAKEQTCLTSASSCDECIQSGPECAWCTAPNANIRCQSLKRLERAGCQQSYMYNPQGRLQVVKNDSSTDQADAKTLFLQPQELSLHLRAGVRQSFPLTISMPTDQPVSELTMDTSNVPAGVNITFSSMMTGSPLLVQVNVEAAQCPSQSDGSNQNKTGPWSVHITPRGFSMSVKLDITLQCQCNCTGNREEKSPACSGQGALMCGQCECYENYDGKRCELDLDYILTQDESFCHSSPDAPPCSGRGTCVHGYCECEKRANPEEGYFGKYCECNNADCPHFNNRICGGKGKCHCGRCVCDDDWTGTDCSCSMETASCMATNNQLCNGRGSCVCGTCQCERGYAGPSCEECSHCANSCQVHFECVECRAFGTGAKSNTCDEVCSYLNVTVVKTKDEMPQAGKNDRLCRRWSDHDSCFFFYTISRVSSERRLNVTLAKECPQK